MEVIGEWLRELVLPGLGVLLTSAALALALRYIGMLDDERLRQLLTDLVQAAEKIYGPSTGTEKRTYVMDKLEEYGYHDVPRSLLEAVVYELDK